MAAKQWTSNVVLIGFDSAQSYGARSDSLIFSSERKCVIRLDALLFSSFSACQMICTIVGEGPWGPMARKSKTDVTKREEIEKSISCANCNRRNEILVRSDGVSSELRHTGHGKSMARPFSSLFVCGKTGQVLDTFQMKSWCVGLGGNKCDGDLRAASACNGPHTLAVRHHLSTSQRNNNN